MLSFSLFSLTFILQTNIHNQKSISDDAALPQETPSSAGRRIVSWLLDDVLELGVSGDGLEEEVEGVEEEEWD